jgi:hypothetical protein
LDLLKMMTWSQYCCWLVVWNMTFIFPNSWDDDPISFSEGLKPPTWLVLDWISVSEHYSICSVFICWRGLAIEAFSQ